MKYARKYDEIWNIKYQIWWFHIYYLFTQAFLQWWFNYSSLKNNFISSELSRIYSNPQKKKYTVSWFSTLQCIDRNEKHKKCKNLTSKKIIQHNTHTVLIYWTEKIKNKKNKKTSRRKQKRNPKTDKNMKQLFICFIFRVCTTVLCNIYNPFQLKSTSTQLCYVYEHLNV